MPNCTNKIKKKQIEWVPYTTDDNEFCTISPGGGPHIPDGADFILVEDADSVPPGEKYCTTIQNIVDLAHGNPAGRIDDTFFFGDTSNNFSNKFLPAGESQNPSNQSTAIMIADGAVIKIVVSNNDDGNNFDIEVIEGAYDGLPGSRSGGTIIGTVTKPAGVYDMIFDVNYPVSKDSRVSVYIKKGQGPQSGANKPIVKLYIRFDDAV